MLLLIGLTIGCLGGLTGQASDLSTAKSSAPAGMTLGSYFDYGDFSSDGVTNSASVVDTGRSDGTSMIQLNDATGQLGTIWSKDGYRLNLNKDATFSMWMYFGNRNSDAANGMAFVLQNDANGANAVSRDSNGKPATGETLGVWGSDSWLTQTGSVVTSSVAENAIQNSWALEFDTEINRTAATGNGFDSASAVLFPHIASNYPGSSSSYVFNLTSNYALLTHKGIITQTNKYTTLSDGTWHHVTLNWNSSTNTMTYTYNDKNATTGAAQTAIGSQSIVVDRSVIDPDNTGYARWGFTGSTGSTNYETNAVVFEQIPSIVDSSAATTVTDTTKGTAVTSGSTVPANDHLRVDYKLTYNSGQENWQNIAAKLTIPSALSVSSAKITYANGDTSTIDTSGLSNQALTYKLADELSSSNQTATISVSGKAVGSKTVTTAVAATTSTFAGTNGVTTATTPDFTVAQIPTTSLTMLYSNNSNIMDLGTVSTDQTVTGLVTMTGSTTGTVTLHPTLNGTALATQTLSGKGSQSFSYSIPYSSLATGTNTLDMYATDSLGDVSNDTQITLTKGSLDFGTVSGDLTFSDNLTGASETVAPTSIPTITVADTRGSDSDGWHLTASATTLTSGPNIFSGNLVYQSGDGSQVVLDSTANTIDTGASDSTTDVSGSWSKTWTDKTSKGIFLQIPSDAVAGDYSGTVNWVLTSGPS